MGRVICLLFLVVVSLFGCQKKEETAPPRPVRALKLEEEESVGLRAFPGRTSAVDRVNLSFRVEGLLLERPAKIGLVVKKGDLLAKIDPRDYEVKLESTQGLLERVEAQTRFAERDFKRAEQISKSDPGAISRSQLDQKEEEWNELKGQVRSAAAKVAQAQDQLDYTSLIAPFDGIISAIYVDNFEYVRAKQPIARLLDLSHVEMEIHIPENMISDIPFVDKVSVQFDVFPGRSFPGRITEVGSEASVTTRTYPVTIGMDQPKDVMILSGMAGYALLSSKKRGQFSEEGFLIPTTALFSEGEESKTYVWTVDPESDEVKKVPVLKGKVLTRGILITQGLEAGSWVVTSGVTFLREGQKVRLVPVVLNDQGDQVELMHR